MIMTGYHTRDTNFREGRLLNILFSKLDGWMKCCSRIRKVECLEDSIDLHEVCFAVVFAMTRRDLYCR